MRAWGSLPYAVELIEGSNLFGTKIDAINFVAGWAFAQQPYLLPPELTVSEAAAPDVT